MGVLVLPTAASSESQHSQSDLLKQGLEREQERFASCQEVIRAIEEEEVRKSFWGNDNSWSKG